MPAVLRAAKWVPVPVVGALWAIRRLVRTSLFYDEWTLVAQSLRLSPWRAAVASFNGHLWLFQDLVYRAQVRWFGVDHHWLVVAVFVAVLVALHLTFARLAVAAGLSVGPALVAGFTVAYLGRGSQDFLFAVQVSPMAATALSLAACRAVLVTEPTRRASMLVGTAALLAVLTESGAGGVGLVMAAVIVAVSWGARQLVALAPAAAVTIAWLLLADGGPHFPAGLTLQARWAGTLLLHGAGALVGGRAVAGIGVLVIAGATAWWLGRERAWSRAGAALALAGLAGAFASAGAVARTRAGLPGLELVGSNRYVHAVAVPLAVAVVAVAAAAARRVRYPQVVVWAMVGVLLAGVAASLPAERAYARGFIDSNRVVREGVRAAAVLVATGCPSGAPPHPEARPVGSSSPQITVALVADLMARGHLRVDAAWTVPDAVVRAVCPG